MVTLYTKKVTEAIQFIASKCKKVDDISIEDSIGLIKYKGKQGIYFVTDITFIMGNSSVYIFQLCDSQASSQKQILGDFFSALLSREVKKIYFFVPPNKKRDVKLICDTIHSVLVHKIKIPKSKLQDYAVYSVKDSNLEKMKEEIKKIAQTEKWGYED